MPQLKKVVLAVGNRLIYADTYEQALGQLSTGGGLAPPGGQPTEDHPQVQAGQVQPVPDGVKVKPVLTPGDPRIESIRQHLQRYRDLTSQGKMVDAARELEAIQNEVQK
jgi:hypothetical protein